MVQRPDLECTYPSLAYPSINLVRRARANKHLTSSVALPELLELELLPLPLLLLPLPLLLLLRRDGATGEQTTLQQERRPPPTDYKTIAECHFEQNSGRKSERQPLVNRPEP